MRLDSVSLHGFKSFAERTVLKVTPGITAIVGPNGCGKSNISESVRWALGEQSAKSLRGQRMEDLIFHGSASRKPVGFAEVELTFSNDGVLSVPWTEVSVSRRLYRTGESEYFLNKNLSRLRDILDLFAGTGANPRAYSVMDQDKLNHVLTAKPQERRVFIEEAAGIARYKQQRNETQGKLDATRQNLVRVRDVMDEVKRQLSSLERQAKKARQYKALQTTKRDLALAVLAAEYMARVAEGERRRRGSGRCGWPPSASTSCGTRASCGSARPSSAGARSGSRPRSLTRRPRRRGFWHSARASPKRATWPRRSSARSRASASASWRGSRRRSVAWPRRRARWRTRGSRSRLGGRVSKRLQSSSVPARATARACAPCSGKGARRRWRASWGRWRTSWRCHRAWNARSKRSWASVSSGWSSNASSTRARRSRTSKSVRWVRPRSCRSNTCPCRLARCRTRTA